MLILLYLLIMKKQLIIFSFVVLSLSFITYMVNKSKSFRIQIIKENITKIKTMELLNSSAIYYGGRTPYSIMVGFNEKDKKKYEMDLPVSARNLFKPGEILQISYFSTSVSECVKDISVAGKKVIIFDYPINEINSAPYSFCKSTLRISNEIIKTSEDEAVVY